MTSSRRQRPPLEKIIELCQVQIMTVRATEKAPCKDEFEGLMTVIKGWAEKARGEK